MTDQLVIDQAAADKVVADKAVADKAAADKTITDKAVADKAVADKVVADKAAADKAATSWRNEISEDNKTYAEQFTDVNALLTHHKGQRQALSTAVSIPGTDASEEDVAAYRKKIGVPDAFTDYKLTRPDDLPDALKTDEAVSNEVAFAEMAHKLHLTDAQVQGSVDYYRELQVTTAEATVKKQTVFAEESETALKKEWGTDYDRNKGFAENVLRNFFDDPDAALTLKTDDNVFLLDHPIMVRALAKLGRAMGEDGMGPSSLSPEGKEATQEEIDTLTAKQFDKPREFTKQDETRLGELYEKLHGTEPGDGRMSSTGVI